MSREITTGEAMGSLSNQVMVPERTDQRAVERSRPIGTHHLSGEDLAIVIASRCEELSRLASEDHLIQCS